MKEIERQDTLQMKRKSQYRIKRAQVDFEATEKIRQIDQKAQLAIEAAKREQEARLSVVTAKNDQKVKKQRIWLAGLKK